MTRRSLETFSAAGLIVLTALVIQQALLPWYLALPMTLVGLQAMLVSGFDAGEDG